MSDCSAEPLEMDAGDLSGHSLSEEVDERFAAIHDDQDMAFMRQYAKLLKPLPPLPTDISESEKTIPSDDPNVIRWAAKDAAEDAVKNALLSLSAWTDDSDYPSALKLQDVLVEQQKLKQRVDNAFHTELHAYTSRALRVVPDMLDLCDVLDDSFDQCSDTADFLQRCRQSVSASVRICALQRRRRNLQRLVSAVDAVNAWVTKVDTVVLRLQQRDFTTAVVMLGARMYSDNGSPLLQRDRLNAAQSSSSAATVPTVSPSGAPAAATENAEAASSASKSGEEGGAAQRKGRQRSTTIAYMAHSHGGAARPPQHQSADTGSPNRAQSPSRGRESMVASRERGLEEFYDNVGGDVAQTVVGRAALTSYYDLKENGTELVVLSMKAEVEHLLTQHFDCRRFYGVLDGLYALKVQKDSISRFFVECVNPVINTVMYQALIEVVGDDAGRTWEDVTATLVPSEFHDCTLQVLAKLCFVVRSTLKIQQFCEAVVAAEDARLKAVGDDAAGEWDESPQRSVRLSACRFLSSIGTETIKSALASVLYYSTQIKLSRGGLEDALHVYRLLSVFVDVCGNVASSGGAAVSTKGSLRFHMARLIRDEFLTKVVEQIVPVIQNDPQIPFAAGDEDFPNLFPYLPASAVAVPGTQPLESDASRFEYLSLPKALETSSDELLRDVGSVHTKNNKNAAGDTLDAKLDAVYSDGAVNPFFSSALDMHCTPVAAASTTPLRLHDGHPLFTFSSLMVCKKMMEIAACVVHHIDATQDLMNSATYLACVYTWYILTHLMPSVTESVNGQQDTNNPIPSSTRDFAKMIQNWITHLPLPSGYPDFAGKLCVEWKSRTTLAQFQFAAQERITAICSIEAVIACHRLIVCALTPLMHPDSLSQVANVSEALASVCKYCVAHGIRKVSLSLFSPETVAASLEKLNLSSAVPPPAVDNTLSPPMKSLADQVHAIHQRLRDTHRDMPFIAAQKLIEHVVFNLCCGVVEGVSRMRKFNDAGRVFLVQDVANLCKLMQTLHPSIPLRLFEYVQLYTKAFTGNYADALQFVGTYHGWYTSKQLNAIAEKEGFLRKRDVEQILSKVSHEDKLPLSLLEG